MRKPCLEKKKTSDKDIEPNIKIVNVSLGGGHSCWITAAGLVYAAGSGSCGQLGNGQTNDQLIPVQMQFKYAIGDNMKKAAQNMDQNEDMKNEEFSSFFRGIRL